MNAPIFEPLDHMEFESGDRVAIEAERGLLGMLLLDERLFDLVADLVHPNRFSVEFDGSIYAAISAMAHSGRPVNAITVFEHMQGKVDLMYLNAMTQGALASQRMARRYAEIIVERSKARQLASVVLDAREVAADDSLSVTERIEQVSAKLASLAEDAQSEDWVSADTGMDEFMAEMDKRASGARDQFLPTGFADLDEQLDGGMREGELIIIGARPSMGKTALALGIGEYAAKLGKTVAMFSLEMKRQSLFERRVSSESGVPLGKIKRPDRMTGQDWTDMSATAEALKKRPFYVNDRSSLNINTLRTKVRALKRRHGLRLLIVDYLGLMDGSNPKDNRTTQLGEVTRNLKRLANELGITVLLLCQLNREVEKRVDQMPVMSDLRDCGEIEQDADIVLFPHRPIHLKPSLGEPWRYYACLRVAKQRAGATGDLNLRYYGPCVRFENWHGDKPSATSVHNGTPDFE